MRRTDKSASTLLAQRRVRCSVSPIHTQDVGLDVGVTRKAGDYFPDWTLSMCSRRRRPGVRLLPVGRNMPYAVTGGFFILIA